MAQDIELLSAVVAWKSACTLDRLDTDIRATARAQRIGQRNNNSQSCISFKCVSLLALVGASWRRGVLTTWGGIAGIGLGHLLGREHDSTPRVGWRLLAC